jgi:hypothetical protein
MSHLRGLRRRILAIVAAGVIATAGAGVGAYFVGHSGGEDLDSARAAGRAAGEKRGQAVGEKQGLAQGRRQGQAQAFGVSFTEAYVAAFRREFRDAGLNAPGKIEIPKGVEPAPGE